MRRLQLITKKSARMPDPPEPPRDQAPLLSQQGSQGSERLSRQFSNFLPTSRTLMRQPSPDDATQAKDILQFSAPIYYLDETEGVVEIDVMRLGSMEGCVSASYATQDGSGVEGRTYIATTGTVVFEDGQHSASIKVVGVKNEFWEPTLEFAVKLSVPENCQIGKYLGVCRVKSISDDCFPTNAFNEHRNGAGQDVTGFRLWLEYCRLNYTVPGVAWRTIFVLCTDQTKNLYLYFKLWFNVYLVDVVLSSNHDTSSELLIPGYRADTAFLMGILWLLPSVMLHAWDILRLHIGIKSMSLAFLQESLFRKYLNYSEDSRMEVLPSDMLVSISADCADVAESYCTALSMVTGLVKIGILANFIFHKNPGALWVMIVMPCIMAVFSMCRLHKQIAVSVAAGEKEIEMMSFVNEICQKYRLVADYMQRPLTNSTFAKKAAETRRTKRPETLVFMNSEYFPTLLGFLFVGVYISTNSMHVVGGEISLGTYLATINVFKEVADAFTDQYSSFVSLTRTFEPLGGLFEMLNLPTDLAGNKILNRQCREESKRERHRLISEKSGDDQSTRFLTDLMSIKFEGLSLQYGDDVEPVLQGVDVSCRQGELVAVTGPAGSGRATLLKTLGKVIFPTAGTLFTPTHLRVLHVSKDPVLMRASLWENVSFGLPKDGSESSEIQRSRDVLGLFGSQNLVDVMDAQLKLAEQAEPAFGGVLSQYEERNPEAPHLWQERLTSMDRAVLHLARAFIMNPEVMVMQRTLSNFSTYKAMRVLQDVFMEFVERKGICLPTAGEATRRPRTLFFVPEDPEQAAKASVVWSLEVLNSEVSKRTMTVQDLSRSTLAKAEKPVESER